MLIAAKAYWSPNMQGAARKVSRLQFVGVEAE
jgi:hypothetical protein